MIYTLENEQVKLQVKSHGAEMTSLVLKETQVEYLWQADPQYWPRHAPVLFPVVGKLPQNRHIYKGESFEISQHGFARDLEFRLAEQTDAALLFELRESEQTLQRYPWPFRLQIQYTLHGTQAEVTYRVQNPGQEELYFSIGAHPAFNCPLLPGEAFTDYYLAFEQPETLERHLLQDGLFSGETEPVLQQEKELPLSHDLFREKDAVVFKGMRSATAWLRSRNHSHGVEMGFKGFPYFGIWSKGEAPFVCLEPWYGLAGKAGAPVELKQKEGIQRLQPGEEFACRHTIRVF